MKRTVILLVTVAMLAGCGHSYEEKRQQSHKRRAQLLREDSAALKVAVMPTLDCLPLFVASDCHLIDTAKADVRLKLLTAQMDCDTALAGGSVQGAVTDLVRAERLQQKGTPLTYVTATQAYWQLYSSRQLRIRQLKQLDDRMVGMTRYSATDLLADLVADSAKLERERFFKIQVNDVFIRLKMLTGSEIDAVLLTEPQATQARLDRQQLLFDSRQAGMALGVIAFREKDLKDKRRQQQLDVLKRAYDQACDSIARYGIAHYRATIERYCQMKAGQVDSLPKDLKFARMAPPAEADVERARKWLKQQ